jgi:hypothetical protein
MKHMKPACIAALALCLHGIPAFSAPADACVSAIRNRYRSINASLRHYSQIERPLPGYSTEGGQLDAYYYRSAPRKLVAFLYGCSFQSQTEYYFWDNRLVLVDEVRLDGAGAMSREVPIPVRRRENRFYFRQGRLVRWIAPGQRKMPVENSDARQKQVELLNEARGLLALARRH